MQKTAPSYHFWYLLQRGVASIWDTLYIQGVQKKGHLYEISKIS